jgi:hypothetical protein
MTRPMLAQRRPLLIAALGFMRMWPASNPIRCNNRARV